MRIKRDKRVENKKLQEQMKTTKEACHLLDAENKLLIQEQKKSGEMLLKCKSY
jgi:hypothetical protein